MKSHDFEKDMQKTYIDFMTEVHPNKFKKFKPKKVKRLYARAIKNEI
jgi:hypothetical protein